MKTIKQFTMLPDFYFTPDKLEAYKDGNLLKGGIVHADAITTVSNTYAEEIKMPPFYGEGLDGLMRARAGNLRGIVNGSTTKSSTRRRIPTSTSTITPRISARKGEK